MSINGGMDKEDVVHIHNGMLVRYKNEWNCALCRDMDGPKDCHTKWSKSEKEKQILHNIASMWNLRLHFHFSLSCIGEGNGNPLQCSCLENPRDSGAWWAAIYGVAQSRTRLTWLSSSSSMSNELVMLSNHLILCHPILLPSNFPSTRVFYNESVFTSGGQSIGVSASASVFPMNTQDWFPLE